MSTPAEQIARFIGRHPAAWEGVCVTTGNVPSASVALRLDGLPPFLLSVGRLGWRVHVLGDSSRRGDAVRLMSPDDFTDGPVARLAVCVVNAIGVYGTPADTLPPWLADPVRRHLRTRAGELLTLAGSSPADVVSAAETLDEALCGRPVVEVTGVLRALMSVGMSCRWATGADEAADDYVGFVSRRLDVVAGERDALRAAIVQALADLDAYEALGVAKLPGLAVLRRVLGAAP